MTDDTTSRPTASAAFPKVGAARPALDADDLPDLMDNPACEDAKIDVGSDESFPASDPVAVAMPRKGDEPPPSSGYKGS